MGFEPTTAALEGRCSTPELLPRPVLLESIIAGRHVLVDVEDIGHQGLSVIWIQD